MSMDMDEGMGEKLPLPVSGLCPARLGIEVSGFLRRKHEGETNAAESGLEHGLDASNWFDLRIGRSDSANCGYLWTWWSALVFCGRHAVLRIRRAGIRLFRRNAGDGDARVAG